jgi:Mn-dependent DtxR family transcriptional regulator
VQPQQKGAQRLGRWLLAHQYRTGMSQFAFTHGFLAEQLRVQRATVTESLAGLQKQKIIKYGYGSVELLHAKALEKKACECFQQAKAAVENFLADIRSYTGNELSW